MSTAALPPTACMPPVQPPLAPASLPRPACPLCSAASLSRLPSTIPDSLVHACRQLPRFDVTLMDHFLDDQRALKDEVYALFKQHPELLVAVEEGMTKGG